MIKSVKDLTDGVYGQAASEGFDTLSQFLDHGVKTGKVDSSFIPAPEERKQAAGRHVSAVKHILAANGIKGRGYRAATLDTMREKGLGALIPAFLSEAYREASNISLFRNPVSVLKNQAAVNSDVYTTADVPDAGAFAGGFANFAGETPLNQLTLGDLVTSTTTIDGGDYRTLTVDSDAYDESLEPSRVAEGSDIPRYKLELAEQSVGIFKYGARITATYEALRRSPLDLVALTIAGIAWADAQRRLRAAIEVALNGDGNSNPAINQDTATTAWAVTDFDLLEALMASYGRSPALYAGDSDTVTAIRALRVPAAGQALTPDQVAMYGAQYITPSGVPLRFAPPASVLEGSDALLVRAAGFGLEMVTEAGSLIREADRNIVNQTQDFTMTENVGFAKPNPTSFFTLTLDS